MHTLHASLACNLLTGAQAKVEELDKRLKEYEAKNSRLTDDLKKKDEAVSDMKKQMKKNERRYHEKLEQRDKQVLALKLELDNKGHTIAYLTTEMHKYKVLQHDSSRELDHPHSPTAAEQVHKRKSHRVTSATDIKSRPVTAKGTMPRPDAEVFLARAVPSNPEPETVAVKPTPPVLPPITGGEDANKAFNRRQQLIRRRLDMKSQPEYSKLAVDKLTSNTNTWVHEPNTTK